MKNLYVPHLSCLGLQKIRLFKQVDIWSAASAGIEGSDRHSGLITRRHISIDRDIEEARITGTSGEVKGRKTASLRSFFCRTERSVARCMVSGDGEIIIIEAETALAWQTPATYRVWFSHWRSRGVGVNDLLNMTWVWRQRSTG